MGIAFFDFDGTICTGDSFLAFIRYAKGMRAYRRGIIRLSPWIVLFYLRRYPASRLKERFFSHFFKGMPEDELLQTGEAFAADHLPQICRHMMIERIHGHQQQGHEVIVLTASSPIWLAGWCRAQGLRLIGTAFQTKDGRYTGRLEGINCKGKRKKEIVAAILARRVYTQTFGYGDSRDDAPFLSLLQHVNNSDQL